MKKINKIAVLFVLVLTFSGIIEASHATSANDDVIKQKIESEASANATLRSDKVKIAVENGYVVLYGAVDRYIQKMLYEKIAWKTGGVAEVENEIRVVPIFPQSDIVIEKEIKKIVQTYRQFQDVTMSVNVESGAVNVLVTLAHPANVFFLKEIIAEIDGVISIDIIAKFIT